MHTRPDYLTYSASSESAWRACQRKWWWGYRHGFRSTERADALETGSAWHALLEGYWRDAAPTPEPEPQNPREAKLAAMLAGYLAAYPIDQRPEVVAIEQRYRLPLLDDKLEPVGDWPMVGAMDALVRIDGEVWIVESKTCSEDISPGAAYWQRLPLDPQISSYWLAGQAIGYDIAGVLYDVARKPDLKPFKMTPQSARKYTKAKPCKEHKPDVAIDCENCQPSRLYADQREHDETMLEYRDRCLAAITEDPSKYFRREPVRRLLSQVEQHMKTQASYARQMDQAISDDYAPQNPSACFLFNRPCDFWAVCCAGPTCTPRDIPGAFTTREERGSYVSNDLVATAQPIEDDLTEDTEDWF